MDYFKQAFAISGKDKQAAEQLYKEAVKVLTNKSYVAKSRDAHTELSEIFGERWIKRHTNGSEVRFNAQLYAEANVAFNYANSVLGARGKFKELAKQQVAAGERVSDETLKDWCEHMNFWVTCTKAEDYDEYFVRN